MFRISLSQTKEMSSRRSISTSRRMHPSGGIHNLTACTNAVSNGFFGLSWIGSSFGLKFRRCKGYHVGSYICPNCPVCHTLYTMSVSFGYVSVAGVFLLIWAAHFVYLVIWRLCFSPLSQFPGSKLAAATGWYEFYYDFFYGGKYIFEIERMHNVYGKQLSYRSCKPMSNLTY
jgi:hypothetical protein